MTRAEYLDFLRRSHEGEFTTEELAKKYFKLQADLVFDDLGQIVCALMDERFSERGISFSQTLNELRAALERHAKRIEPDNSDLPF